MSYDPQTMLIPAVVIDAIAQVSTVVALVGARIYTDMRAQNSALPAIVITIDSDDEMATSFSRECLVRKAHISCYCISTTLKISRKISSYLRRGLHGAHGQSRGVKIVEMRAHKITTSLDTGMEGDQSGNYYAVSVDLEMTYISDAAAPITITDAGDGVPDE